MAEQDSSMLIPLQKYQFEQLFMHENVFPKSQGNQVRDYNTWVWYGNKKRCIEEGRKDSFTFPRSPFPHQQATQPGERYLACEEGRRKWTSDSKTKPAPVKSRARQAMMAPGSRPMWQTQFLEFPTNRLTPEAPGPVPHLALAPTATGFRPIPVPGWHLHP